MAELRRCRQPTSPGLLLRCRAVRAGRSGPPLRLRPGPVRREHRRAARGRRVPRAGHQRLRPVAAGAGLRRDRAAPSRARPRHAVLPHGQRLVERPLWLHSRGPRLLWLGLAPDRRAARELCRRQPRGLRHGRGLDAHPLQHRRVQHLRRHAGGRPARARRAAARTAPGRGPGPGSHGQARRPPFAAGARPRDLLSDARARPVGRHGAGLGPGVRGNLPPARARAGWHHAARALGRAYPGR